MISAIHHECRENTYRIKPVDMIAATSRMSARVRSVFPRPLNLERSFPDDRKRP